MENQEPEQAKKTPKPKTKMVAVIIVVVLVLGFAGGVIWLAKAQMTPNKQKILSRLSFPITLVNSEPIFSNQYFSRLSFAEKLVKDDPEADKNLIKQSLLQGMVEEVKIDQLAAKVGVSVAQKEVDTEFNQRAKFTQIQQGKALTDLLTEYGINESFYKDILLKPDILLSNLAVWFNKQKNLNEQGYKTVAEVQARLDQGEKLESLVATYSQDQASAELEGDLGFVEFADLPLEIAGELETMSVGEIKTVASRYGLHIVKLEERDNKGENNGSRMHLRQIFIAGGDFESWYKESVKDYKVKQLVKM